VFNDSVSILQSPVGRPVSGKLVSPDSGVTVSFQNTFPPAAPGAAVVQTGTPHLHRLPPGHLQGKLTFHTHLNDRLKLDAIVQ
jgi:hypothetical protein